MSGISRSFHIRFRELLVASLLAALCSSLMAQALKAQAPAISSPADSDAPRAGGSISAQNGAGTPNAASAGGSRVGSTCDLIAGPLTCLVDVFRDQGGIWTAPARMRGRKLLWLAPFAVATTVALETDVTAMNALGPSPTRIRASNDFTYLGSGYTLVPAAGLVYLVGKLDHNERTREAGMLSLEALADAGLMVEGLKLATNRQRPYVAPGTGKFWPDDTDIYTTSGSFPSGHSAASWAVARVMVEETPGHRWLHVLFYGAAASVAIARVTGENHFPSDILVGSVIGYEIGGYTYHHHSAFYIPKAKALRIAPLYNPATASYGVSLSLQP